MNILQLDKLSGGIAGISNAYGAFLAEAAVMCLDALGHTPGVILKVEGDFEALFRLEWQQQIGVPERLSWGDLKEATEYAAMGIALLLLESLTEYSVFQRNDQSGVGDFTLTQNFYQSIEQGALLEVSGIFAEIPNNTVSMRLLQKKKNHTKRNRTKLPFFTAIVAFNVPKAIITKL
jgi:hypothetical protein